MPTLNRRMALTTMGLAAVGSELGSRLRAQQPDCSVVRRRTTIGGIELAIATICIDGFSNQHHEPAIRWIPDLGFKHVELNLWYLDQMSPSYVKRLGQRCRDAGISPISIQSIGFGTSGQRPDTIKDVSHKVLMMQLAKSLGCNIVKFTGAKRGTAGGLPAIIEACKALEPIAEDLGVFVALENHTGNNLETIEDYEQIFDSVASPMIGLCLDTGHFEGSGIHLDEVLRRLGSRTVHVDLKDCQEFGAGHDTVVFGQGVTDFDAFLNPLIDSGYRGYLVVEQAWPQPKGDWRTDLQTAYRRFEEYRR